jgi:ATP-dependent Lon protease
MAREIQIKRTNTNTKKAKEPVQKKKKVESSDSEGDNGSNDDEDEDEMDETEYRKFLSKIFPSKHLDKKIAAGTRLKKKIQELEESEEEEEADEEEEEEEVKKRPSKKDSKKKKASKKKQVVESESDDEEDDADDEDEEEEDEDDDVSPTSKSAKNFNIIFTIGNGGGGEYEDDDEEGEWEDYDENEDDSDYVEETEDEDEDVSDSDTEDEDEAAEEEEEAENIVIKNKKAAKQGKKSAAVHKEASVIESAPAAAAAASEPSSTNSTEFMNQMKELYEKNKSNAMAKECLKICEQNIKKIEKKEEKKNVKRQAKNTRIFRKIVKDKNTMNDFEFFNKLQVEEQKKIIKELREINKITRIEKPYRLTLLESDMPVLFKGAAMKKINSLRYMEPGSGEYYKIKNWVDTFMRIPFGKYQTLPVNIDNGVEQCHDFMENAKKTLDTAVYGLNEAKMQIMQMMGQLITNPSSIGTAIAIQGPMGTGKTSLVKEGISKILNRPFAFIALGGATDSSFLEGHSYTYEGSTWGKIVQILVDSKCMNPVIYFDELDKISDTPKGEEIAGILTHLTDTSQNSQYHDKYFAEVDFDLSKCLFIFSYNDESKVNPILRDRMYRIHTKGYDKKQKTIISNNHLLPKIREQVKFNDGDIIIPDETLHYIMENHCNKEDGVRNMKRCLEIIYTKLNLYRLMKPGTNLFEESMTLKVEFPFKVTTDIVDKLITKEKEDSTSFRGMYV